MSDFQGPVKQPVMAPESSFSEQEPAGSTMMPPAFQLMASGGGDPKKKAPKPTNDHSVGPDAYGAAKSKPIPDAIIHQIEQEITGIEHLEIAADLIIVHSPCYSAEIYTIISMVNDGSMELAEGKKEIMDRIVYLLSSEFKDAEGQPNEWAKSNLSGTTVDNDENMGAEWYRHGENGPKYLALTDWNDQAHPEEGGNQYEMFKMNPPVKDGEEPDKPFFQPFGNPMTSRDSNGQNTEGNKAKETGNPIDITWLQRILQMFSPSIGRKKTAHEKADDLKGKGKLLSESSDNDEKKQEEENTKEALKKMEVEKEKGENTEVTYERISKKNGKMEGTTQVTFSSLMKLQKLHPESNITVKAVSAVDSEKDYLKISEVRKILAEKTGD